MAAACVSDGRYRKGSVLHFTFLKIIKTHGIGIEISEKRGNPALLLRSMNGL
jgi:hypothetical protein